MVFYRRFTQKVIIYLKRIVLTLPLSGQRAEESKYELSPSLSYRLIYQFVCNNIILYVYELHRMGLNIGVGAVSIVSQLFSENERCMNISRTVISDRCLKTKSRRRGVNHIYLFGVSPFYSFSTPDTIFYPLFIHAHVRA